MRAGAQSTDVVCDDECRPRVLVVDLEANPIELSLCDFADLLGEMRILSRIEARLLRHRESQSVTTRMLN